jgi:hypothetical protein
LLDTIIPKWARLPIFIVAAVAAVGEMIKAVGNYLNDFASQALELDSIAKELGMSVGKLKAISDQLGKAVGPDAGKQMVRNFKLKMLELQKRGDAYTEALQAAGDTGGNMSKLLEDMFQQINQGKDATAMKMLKDNILKMEKQARAAVDSTGRQLYTEGDIASMRSDFLSEFGQTQEFMETEPEEPSADQIKRQEALAAKQIEFSLVWRRLTQEVRLVTDELKVALLPVLTEATRWMESQGEHWAERFADKVVEAAKWMGEQYEQLKPLIDWINANDQPTPPSSHAGRYTKDFLSQGLSDFWDSLTGKKSLGEIAKQPSVFDRDYDKEAQNTAELKKLNEGIAKLKERLTQPPDIQKFAQGGTVTRPTLGMVGEGGQPEAVVGPGGVSVVNRPTVGLLGVGGTQTVVPLGGGSSGVTDPYAGAVTPGFPPNISKFNRGNLISGQTLQVGESVSGKGSVFGNYIGPSGNWRDIGDIYKTAGPGHKRGDPLPTFTGTPLNVPGIALPSGLTSGRHEMQEGAYFKVTAPDGSVYYAPQTDIGPQAKTGRVVDINAPLAERMGYVPDYVKGGRHFPTDATFGVERVDPETALWMGQPFQAGPQSPIIAGSGLPGGGEAMRSPLGAADRTLLDREGGRSISGAVNGTGTISVQVQRSGGSANLPAGNNMFLPTGSERQTHMQEAEHGPPPPPPTAPAL